MTVYVDNMRAQFGRMLLSHMLADTPSELRIMAGRLGLKPEWIQDIGTHREHYDVSVRHRALAIDYGAEPVSRKDLALILRKKRAEHKTSEQEKA